jgi:hypothetical protein
MHTHIYTYTDIYTHVQKLQVQTSRAAVSSICGWRIGETHTFTYTHMQKLLLSTSHAAVSSVCGCHRVWASVRGT